MVNKEQVGVIRVSRRGNQRQREDETKENKQEINSKQKHKMHFTKLKTRQNLRNICVHRLVHQGAACFAFLRGRHFVLL